MESLLLDPQSLGVFSRRLATALFKVFPNLEQFASMIQSGESDGLSLQVVVPSPSGDENRLLGVWVDEKATPSIEFGPTHTHGLPDDDGISEIISLCGAIFSDQLLIIEDVGGEFNGRAGWVDLREPDALVEEMTSPYSPGTVRLKSWTGNADRQIVTKDL